MMPACRTDSDFDSRFEVHLHLVVLTLAYLGLGGAIIGCSQFSKFFFRDINNSNSNDSSSNGNDSNSKNNDNNNNRQYTDNSTQFDDSDQLNFIAEAVGGCQRGITMSATKTTQ